MTDIIIIAVIAIIIIVAAKPALKHMKGEGSCCGGGGTVPAKKKKLKVTALKKVMTIEGMHCDNCKNRVMRAINELDGASAKVNVSKGQAVVSMEWDIQDATLKETVEKAGYKVTKIQKL